jgi:hypothetical protein
LRYFYDTEFIENGKTIDLISIGVVREDGRSYYAVSTEFKARKASQCWDRFDTCRLYGPCRARPNRVEFGKARSDVRALLRAVCIVA